MSKALGTPGEFWANGRRPIRKSKNRPMAETSSTSSGSGGSGRKRLTTFEMPDDDEEWRRELWKLMHETLGEVNSLKAGLLPAGSAIAAPKKFYTTQEAGETMNLDPATVEKYCREGKLKAFKAHGRGKSGEWRLTVEEIERWKQYGLRRPPRFPGHNPPDE